MEGAQTLCDEGSAGEIRTDCVKRVDRRSDRLTVKRAITISVVPIGSQTGLLSGPAPAVTVRRLWTGTKAKNVNLITRRSCSRTRGRQGDGTKKRLRWPESLVTFSNPVCRAVCFSLATTGKNGRLRTRFEFLHTSRHRRRDHHHHPRACLLWFCIWTRDQGHPGASTADRGRHRRRGQEDRRTAAASSAGNGAAA